MPAAHIPTTSVFTLDQVAGPVLPCTERFVADKLRAGLWPGHKVGRQWVLTEDDLLRIVESCVVNRTPAPSFNNAITQAQLKSSSMTRTTARRMRRAGGEDAT
jgi:hypothetical protein